MAAMADTNAGAVAKRPTIPAREAANQERLAGLGAAASRAQADLQAAQAATAAARAALEKAQAESRALSFELCLERLATQVPLEVLTSVLRDLPSVELARLSCVHKSFWSALKSLRPAHPGPRYAAPTAEEVTLVKSWHRLTRAGFHGDVAVIKASTAGGMHIYASDAGGRVIVSALARAAQRGHVQAAELLMRSGADVNARSGEALRSASEHGQMAVVQLLLQRGADLYDCGGKSLLRASENGHTAVVELLLRRGMSAGVSEDAVEGGKDTVCTPLDLACKHGHVDVMRLLIQHEVDMQADGDDAPSRYALNFAVTYGRSQVVALLLQHGASDHTTDDWALRYASEVGHVDVLQVLLLHGVNVHAKDDVALRRAAGGGRAAVVALLLQHGANVHANDDQALKWASDQGHTAVVYRLIQHGADVRAGDNTPLRRALRNGHSAIVRLLRKHGARVRQPKAQNAPLPRLPSAAAAKQGPAHPPAGHLSG